jgi:hypothetical protein
MALASSSTKPGGIAGTVRSLLTKPIQQINDEIAAIEAGLAKVADEPYFATVPRNSWL